MKPEQLMKWRVSDFFKDEGRKTKLRGMRELIIMDTYVISFTHLEKLTCLKQFDLFLLQSKKYKYGDLRWQINKQKW